MSRVSSRADGVRPLLAFALVLACGAPPEESGSSGDTAAGDTVPDDTDPDDTDSGDSDSGDSDSGDSDSGDTGAVPACGAPDAERPYCASCAELLAEVPATSDGPATLQVGPSVFETWCEMTTAGGGWTLAATNGWGGGWTEASVLDEALFGEASLTADYKGEGFLLVPFADLLFETDVEYAVYLAVGDGTRAWQPFQEDVPLHNCGVDTPYEWEMAEGTLDDPDICSTNLYIHPIDWEGGLIPCGDSEVATGPAWSGKNKDLGCPLNDPRGTSFIEDPWDYNVWGDHDPMVVNPPLRMWVR